MDIMCLPHSRPEDAADRADTILCWLEASCALAPDRVAIETARAENMTTNIMARMSAAPLRLRRTVFFAGSIFPPTGNAPLRDSCSTSRFQPKYKK